MTSQRRESLLKLMAAAGLPEPVILAEAKSLTGIAAGFRTGGGIQTIEACGSTDSEVLDDLVRQCQAAGVC